MAINAAPTDATLGNCFQRDCIARVILGHLGNRWSSLIVASLLKYEVLRFSEIRAQVDGISEKVLSEKLRELERDGLVSRKMYPVVPPKVEYRLTEMGHGAAVHIKALVLWIESNVGKFFTAREAYDGLTKATPKSEITQPTSE